MRIAVFFLFVAWTVHADECVEIIPGHSEVRFEILRAGEPFSDAFEKSGGEICLSGQAVTSIDAWLDPASIETGLPALDAAILGDAFLAAERFPRVVFESHRVEKADEGYVAHGTLTMKGVEKPLLLRFRLRHDGADYIATGETSLRRRDFDIGGEWADMQQLGEEVRVTFSVRAR